MNIIAIEMPDKTMQYIHLDRINHMAYHPGPAPVLDISYAEEDRQKFLGEDANQVHHIIEVTLMSVAEEILRGGGLPDGILSDS
jgi:hypothetical protein